MPICRSSARAVFALAAMAGCSSTRDAALPLVRAHAAHDLRCPDKSIRVDRMMGERWRAAGCGREVVYHSACVELRCTVGRAGEEPQPWRDRPEPGSLDEVR
jgi:hypothetical protein